MKQFHGFLFVLLVMSLPAWTARGAATPGTAGVECATVTEGWGHSPNHVLAVWVTDAKTNFVKTVLKRGEKRAKHLVTWNRVRRGNPWDGETGATLTTHGPVSAIWNCLDWKDALVPDGTYLFFVEFTEENGQGPLAVFPFFKGPQAQSKIFTNQPNFKAIKVTFTPDN